MRKMKHMTTAEIVQVGKHIIEKHPKKEIMEKISPENRMLYLTAIALNTNADSISARKIAHYVMGYYNFE